MGDAPTYLLTDNEKTVTTGHIAGVPVRNRAAVTFGRYYGISVLTWNPPTRPPKVAWRTR